MKTNSVKRKFVTTAAFACVAIMMVTLARPVAAAETLVLSSYVTVKHWLVSQILTNWAKEVEKETNGEVKIDILASALGKPAAHFDMARDGIADITLSVPGYTPGRYLLTMVGSLPNVGNNAESVAGAMWRMLDQFPQVKKEFDGVVPLALFSTTGLQFWTSKRHIQKFGDFSGLKMHVSGGIIIDVAKGLGATPVPQPTATAYQTISNGVVDGIVFTTNGVDAFKLSKVISYGTRIPGGFMKAPILLAMNPAKFNSLSKKNQDALMRVSGEALSRRGGKTWEGKDDVSVKNLRNAGVTVDEAAPGLRKQIDGAIDTAIGKWLKAATEKRSFDARPLLAAFRTETKNIEAGN